METLTISQAYKFVAMLVMLIEVNHYVEALGLRMEMPVTISGISGTSTVSPPALVGFSGSIVTRTYFFGFTEGRLRYIHSTDGSNEGGRRSSTDLSRGVVRGCGTNDAYSRGLKLLAAVQMDTRALEKIHQPSFALWQTTATDGDTKQPSDRLGTPSLVEVAWGRIQVHPRRKYMVPAVAMAFSARDCQLVKLRIEGPSEYWKRPAIRVNDIHQLQAIANERFARMTAKERKLLFEKHTGMPYPSKLIPHVATEEAGTNAEGTAP